MAFPTDWGRKCALTIADAMAGGALSDFPLLLTHATGVLPSEMFDADGSNPALNGGGDIRFSSDSDGNTQLACEIVRFTTDNDPSNGTAEIWVKVPSVAASAATVIYVWYKKSGESQPAVDAAFGRDAVWSDYLCVLHMVESGDGTSGEYADSTGNGLTGIGGDGTESKTPTQTATSHPWGGVWQDFDGGDYIVIENSGGALDDSYMTVQCVAYCTFDRGGIISNNWNTDNQFQMENIDGSARLRVLFNNAPGSGAGLQTTFDTDASPPNWMGFTTNVGGIHIYGDGSLVGEDTTYTGTLQFQQANRVQIGRYFSDSFFIGAKIGEVRIRLDDLSATWIAAEHLNQSAPATYITAGTPASVGGGGATPHGVFGGRVLGGVSAGPFG